MLPKYNPRQKLNSDILDPTRSKECCDVINDCQYYFRASISGLVLSFIDKVPSEVGVVTIRKIVAMSEWNSSRTSEATAALSIDWLQIDNHCPNASFPVALFPSKGGSTDGFVSEFSEVDYPFLSVGIVLAPKHKSRITVRIRCDNMYFISFSTYLSRLHYCSSILTEVSERCNNHRQRYLLWD
jgi:Vacuolar protein sorting-associated protein